MKYIEIYKASQNNLKNIDVKIPLDSFTVVCGLSGSGKSSLAFETLYAEGQRRYLQNLSNYLKQYIIQQPKPHVKHIENLPPALALEQKNPVKTNRSTVATLSGLSDSLRLIFEHLGVAYCPKHKIPLQEFSPSSLSSFLIKNFEGERISLLVPIKKEWIAKPKAFLVQLQKEGFSKILFVKDEDFKQTTLRRAEEIKTLPKQDFFVFIDRLELQSKEKNRLTDSLNQTFSFPKNFFKEENYEEEVVVLRSEGGVRRFYKDKKCTHCGFKFPFPQRSSLFSFNSPLGACATCEGYGYNLELDKNKIIPQPKFPLKNAIHPFNMPSAKKWKKALKDYAVAQKIPLDKSWCNLSLSHQQKIWKGSGSFKGIEGFFKRLDRKKYKMHVRVLISRYRSPFICTICKGKRLKKEVEHVKFKNKSFTDLCELTIGEVKVFFDKLSLSANEVKKCKEAFNHLKNNLKYLHSVGLSYLPCDRPVKTLSNGEFQRLRLANQLGLSLSQVLYILDEPTVGLHPRDTKRVIEILKELKDLGNTIVVVEHDADVIESSDFIIEMGPEAGERGGEVLWSGLKENFMDSKNSNTTCYLKRQNFISRTPRPTKIKQMKFVLNLKGCSGHNLKQINLKLPLNRLIVVTGVSGSGKSSLITGTLYPALREHLFGEPRRSLEYESLTGTQFLKNTVLIDSLEMGKTTRSSVISYIKSYDFIRTTLANTYLAKKKGFTASYFSLNIEGGRCPSCKGLGIQEIDMVFMDAIRITCEECEGKKFKKDILSIKYRNKNVYDILNLTIEEAKEIFHTQNVLLRSFSVLEEVGLSYLRLGQTISSLSGGERQRLKLARELLNSEQAKTLYILDEPTKGLHFKEVHLLLKVLNRLVDSGASVLVIEHNLEVVREADYIIDIGKEAGKKGGEIIASGEREDFLKNKKSYTAKYLFDYLKPCFDN